MPRSMRPRATASTSRASSANVQRRPSKTSASRAPSRVARSSTSEPIVRLGNQSRPMQHLHTPVDVAAAVPAARSNCEWPNRQLKSYDMHCVQQCKAGGIDFLMPFSRLPSAAASHRPDPMKPSISSLHMPRVTGSSSAIAAGVKAGSSIVRWSRCFGGSVVTGGIGAEIGGFSRMIEMRREEKCSVS